MLIFTVILLVLADVFPLLGEKYKENKRKKMTSVINGWTISRAQLGSTWPGAL